MEALFGWLNQLGLDADPTRPGFQAQAMYLVVAVAGPVLFGGSVALLLAGLERAFGIKLAKGGH